MAHIKAPARTIEEFLRQRKSVTNLRQIQEQREARRDHYIAETTKLFDQIKKWLTKLKKSGPIFYKERPITLDEEGIGEYRLTELVVDIADRPIIIRPVGTMVYGALGRVDLLSITETHLIMTEWGEWKWDRRSYAFGSLSKPDLEGLTEEAFKNILYMLVSN